VGARVGRVRAVRDLQGVPDESGCDLAGVADPEVDEGAAAGECRRQDLDGAFGVRLAQAEVLAALCRACQRTLAQDVEHPVGVLGRNQVNRAAHGPGPQGLAPF